MRGTILQYDDNSGSGFISGDDGVRYTFRRADLQQLRPISAGMKVDFVPSSGAATEIYMIDASGAIASGPAPGFGGPAPQPAYGGYATAGPAPTVAYTGEDLGLWDYFKKAMGKSFNGEGRARRKEYWSFVLFVWLIFFVLMILMFVIAGSAISAAMSSSYGYGYGYGSYDGGLGALISALGVWLFVYLVIWLIFLPAIVTVSIRRLHDIGMSGWFVLLCLVPYIGGIFMLVCAFIPSQAYVNQYGPIPKPQPTVYG